MRASWLPLLKRMAQAPLILLVLVTLTFVLTRLAPGDPFASEKALPESTRIQLRKEHNLDGSLAEQFGRYIADLTRGDLGQSLHNRDNPNGDVATMINTYLPMSALLGGLALLLAIILGVAAGVISALRQNTWYDQGVMVLALLGLSIPAFVVGPVLIAIFAIAFDWLPAAGLGSATHLILPVITLALPFCGRIARLARAGMLDVIHQDYVRTARAKGLSEGRIVIVHVLRGGLLPVVSFLGPTTAQVLTGSLVVEQIFAIPGLGHLFINSAEQRDYPVVLGAVIVFGAILIATNLLADIVSAIVDPRIRLA